MARKMDFPAFEDFFKIISINCSLLGIPLKSPKIYFHFYVFIVAMTLIVFGEICFFVSKISTEQFLRITELAPCICVGFLSISKIVCIACKRRKIRNLIICLRNLNEELVNNVAKQNVIRAELFFLKTLIKYYFILNICLIIIYNFSTPLVMFYHYLDKKKVVFMLPYALLLPFSTESWLNWCVVYIYSIICGFLCVLFYTSVDILYYVLSSHICFNFTLIGNELQFIDKNNLGALRDIIKKHQYILKLTDFLEDIFAAPNFFNVLVGSIEICALGFNLTMGSWTQILGVILFLTSVLIQMYMMCLFGETIMRESIRIGESAYLCQWYNMGINSKKLILTILIRSNKPKTLSAYKFSVISYKCFAKIISTSWSYFTILKTVYADKQNNASL